MPDDKVTITVSHPTHSADTLTVAVSPMATPKWLVEQMVHAGFLEKPDKAGMYKLRNAATGVQLNDNTTLAAAGIQGTAELGVDYSMTGASLEVARGS